MPLHYFKPDILIATRCEHCGAQRKETLARLYSDARLACAACGKEHTAERMQFRQTVDNTEAMVASLPSWIIQLPAWLRRWRDRRHGANPP
ncbi:hypothetical protein [Noviherbaspirillum sedimenti]|uniref:Uncharacterized protein n=1 Tax=Noviherbaspirillum sedimenti TaxID=2320865 RepID=A0A3A3G6V5_9BURK|nr:hypothetical protein [Noviherbaspirillum sedimenti]RJG03681.1 hypothetical protein D3878_20535 [Noviherbaspirillum sedimenti]